MDQPVVPSDLPALIQLLKSYALPMLRREVHGQTLHPTALVHSVLWRLRPKEKAAGAGVTAEDWEELVAEAQKTPAEFIRRVCRVMRQVLIDHARKRCARKRGGGQVVQLPEKLRLEDLVVARDELNDLTEAVGVALDRIERSGGDGPLCAEVAEYLLADLTCQEIAAQMGVSVATAQRWRDWARVQLRFNVRRVLCEVGV